jgi:hypothetical protein
MMGLGSLRTFSLKEARVRARAQQDDEAGRARLRQSSVTSS